MLALHPSHQRGQGNYGWLEARYSFSFASWYDPRFMGVSHLRVINEDRVRPLTGFATHSHSNMEILTYVLAGEVSHKDSMGNVTKIKAGEFQLMSAGKGISHSEMNSHPTQTLHLMQIWLVPAEQNTEPRYQQMQFADNQQVALIASPVEQEGSMHIKQDAAVYRLKFKQGEQIRLTSDRQYGYFHLIDGQVAINEIALTTGDALISKDESDLVFTALSDGQALWFDLS